MKEIVKVFRRIWWAFYNSCQAMAIIIGPVEDPMGFKQSLIDQDRDDELLISKEM